MTVDWDYIKEVWEKGIEDLSKVASQFGVSVPEVSLKARQEGWADRDAKRGIVDFSDTHYESDTSVEVLTDKQVTLAHKTDLGRLRLVAASVLDNLQFEADWGVALKSAERLAKIYSQLIPLERKVFGIDVGSDGAPDGITINNYAKE